MDKGILVGNKVAQASTKESQNFEHELNLDATPPPSYPETQSHVPDQQVSSSTSSAYPPLSHHTQAPSLTLHIKYESRLTSHARILDSDNTTSLYTLELHLHKPHITIHSTSTGRSTGTVTFHTFTNRIDTTVHDSSITLTPIGFLRNGHKFTSPALAGAELTLKMKSHKLDFICVDERGVSIARFCFANWSLRKFGKLELIGSDARREDIVEELLVTGSAVVQWTAAAIT